MECDCTSWGVCGPSDSPYFMRLQSEVLLSDTDNESLYIIGKTADFYAFPLAETPYKVATKMSSN